MGSIILNLYEIYWFLGNKKCLLDVADNLNSGIPRIILQKEIPSIGIINILSKVFKYVTKIYLLQLKLYYLIYFLLLDTLNNCDGFLPIKFFCI